MSILEQYGVPPIPVTELTWAMYSNGVPSAYQGNDAAQTPAYPLLSFMSLVGDQMGLIAQIVDNITYVPSSQGGPNAGSEQQYAQSDLVDPWRCADSWIPWLAMVTGTNINPVLGLKACLDNLQARLAIASQPTYGKLQGSKTAIAEAIRALFAFEVTNANGAVNTNPLNLSALTLPLPNPLMLPQAQDNLLNLAESQYIASDTGNLWQEWAPNASLWPHAVPAVAPSSVTYQNQQSFAVTVIGGLAASTQFGVELSRPLPCLGNAPYTLGYVAQAGAGNTQALLTGASVLFNSASATTSGNYGDLGASAVALVSMPSGSWVLQSQFVNTPQLATSVQLALYWQANALTTASNTALFTAVAFSGPDPYGSLRGALILGEDIPSGASVVNLLANSTVDISTALPAGISGGSVVVIPNIPIAVLDHYGTNTSVSYSYSPFLLDSSSNNSNLTSTSTSAGTVVSVTSPVGTAFNQAAQFSGGYLTGPTGTTAADGTITGSAFTVEYRYKPSVSDISSIDGLILSRTGEWQFYFDAGTLYAQVNPTGTYQTVGTASVTAGVAYAIALTWNGTVYTLWVNGVSVGTYSSTIAPTPISQPLLFGSQLLAYSVTGTIDEVRVSNNCRYTTTYVPATAPFTSDANTKMLYHLDGTNTNAIIATNVIIPGSNPWGLGVFVPVGVPLAAAYQAALTQKPAGCGLTLNYTYADWANLYATFGNGVSISWSEIEGESWQTWEQTT